MAGRIAIDFMTPTLMRLSRYDDGSYVLSLGVDYEVVAKNLKYTKSEDFETLWKLTQVVQARLCERMVDVGIADSITQENQSNEEHEAEKFKEEMMKAINSNNKNNKN